MLTLNETDWDELCQQTPRPYYPNLAIDDFEVIAGVPERLGRGYTRSMELLPGVWLDLCDQEFCQNWRIKVPAHAHLVQCSVLLSGAIYDQVVYPTLGSERSYLSGSGISPYHTAQYQRSQRLMMVDIHFLPTVLEQFLAGISENASLSKLFLKPNDWKVSFFPRVTADMRRVAQDIWTTPFYGTARRLYLQSKVFELLTLQLQPLLSDQNLCQPPLSRKPETIARIYHAREVLASQLDNPPALFDLAQQVGVSDRTLRRGFQDLFGTTVIGYLIQQRLEEAEKLLRQGDRTVAEVAMQVGYGNMGHFAVAFKRRFGITPSQCLTGKKVVLVS